MVLLVKKVKWGCFQTHLSEVEVVWQGEHPEEMRVQEGTQKLQEKGIQNHQLTD